MKKFFLFALIPLVMFFCFGCSEDGNPLPSKSHPKEWNVTSSTAFHGKKVLESGKASCTGCHGYDLSGGEAGVACLSCHTLYPHNDQWMVIAAEEFHGEYIADQGWSMESCKKCHGGNYQGGNSKVSCLTCHSDEGGPESCNTCHGSRKNAAPPKDLGSNSAKSAMGVGAHQLHMDAFNQCELCHIVPTAVNDEGHIDKTAHAEIMATLEWNRETGRCAKACHTNPDKSYIWNE
jgi:hypothetical protein